MKPEKKPKKPFLSGYKKYKPEVEGFGSPAQWREAFFERIGFEQAVEVLGSDDPFVLFGLTASATWDDVVKAYRSLARKHHPDLGGDKAMMQKINAAFEVLERRYGK